MKPSAASVLVLRHRKEAPVLPAVRLILTGSAIVTDVAGVGWSTQSFPSPSVAAMHLERVLRVREAEGYSLREPGELTEIEAARFADPLAGWVTHTADIDRGRMRINLERGPLSWKVWADIVARIATVAPSCIDCVRGDEVPGGVLGAALAGNTLPSVRALVYDFLTQWWNAPPPPEHEIDDLAELLAAFPNLERVSAAGAFTLREANHDHLRELHLEGRPLFPTTFVALSGGSLPALSTLNLSLGNTHALDRVAAVALLSVTAPRLGTVRVAALADIARFLRELTERPLPASWATLYLDGSVADEDELLAVLRERAPVLGSLTTLGLPLAEELSLGGGAEAKTMLPSVVEISDLPALLSPSESNDW